MTPRLSYFQTRAVFENIFYCIFGISAFFVISLSYEISLTQIFYITTESITAVLENVERIILESILLVAVSSSAIFLSAGLIFSRRSPTSDKLDFSQTWMNTYLKLNPLGLAIIIAFLPVLAEELFFRILIITLLEKSDVGISWLTIPIIAVVSTSLFIVQQGLMLKSRRQLMAVGIGAFWIGMINSIAFILGSSFYSILFSHYLFVVYMIISIRRRFKTINKY